MLVAAALPGGVLGKGLPPGVHVDPGSPAGTEYQIPLDSARQLSAGSTGGAASPNPPLFGVGVTSARASSPTTTSAPRAAGGRAGPSTNAGSVARRLARRRAHRRPGRAASHGSPATVRRPVRADAAQPGSDSWLPLVAGGALVLVVGGGGGFGLRRKYLQA